MFQRFVVSALLASLAASASAADLLPVSARASVSGLSYHLVDLDPTDGVTPWIKFNGSYVGAGSFSNEGLGSVYDRAYTVDGSVNSSDVFSAAPTNYVSANGLVTASYGPGTAAVSSQLDSNELNRVAGNALVLTGTGDTYNLETVGVAGMAFGDILAPELPGVPLPSPTSWAFTLSANTALVIDGQWHVDAHLDLSQVKAGAFLNGVQATVTSFAAAGVMVGDIFNGEKGMDVAFNNVQLSQSIDANGVGALDARWLGEPQTDGSFSVRFDNVGIDAFNGGLIAGGITEHQLLLTPAIPEPATWALMALGLTGLVATQRSRQKASRQAS